MVSENVQTKTEEKKIQRREIVMEFKVVMYVVIGVGYFLYNLYKKTKSPPVKKSEVDYSEDELEDMDPGDRSVEGIRQQSYQTIDDIVMDLSQQGHVRSAEKQQEVFKSDNKEADDTFDTQDESGASSNISVKSTDDTQVKYSVQDNGYKPRTRRKRVSFDLRKAVLYRAVMERPKY